MRRSAVPLLATVIASAAVSGRPIEDIQWRMGPNLPEYRKGGCAAALGGKVISVFGMRQPWGEMATMYVYDPETDWWSRGPDGPVGQCYVQGTECEGAFHSIGGRKGQVRSGCYKLTVKEDDYAWSTMPELNEARGWAPSVTVGSRLFVFGGARDAYGPTLGSVEMLDLAETGVSWKVVSHIPGETRGWQGAAAVAGDAYVFGGWNIPSRDSDDQPDRKRLAEVLRFDPGTFQWEPKSPLPFRLSGMDCCVYADRYIIVVGGAPEVEDFTEEMKAAYEATDRYSSYYCPFVLVYDTQEDRWSRLPSVLPMPTNDVRVVLIGNSLYVLGGENIEPATSNTTAWFRIGTILE